jgi:hypothetical protein
MTVQCQQARDAFIFELVRSKFISDPHTPHFQRVKSIVNGISSSIDNKDPGPISAFIAKYRNSQPYLLGLFDEIIKEPTDKTLLRMAMTEVKEEKAAEFILNYFESLRIMRKKYDALLGYPQMTVREFYDFVKDLKTAKIQPFAYEILKTYTNAKLRNLAYIPTGDKYDYLSDEDMGEFLRSWMHEDLLTWTAIANTVYDLKDNTKMEPDISRKAVENSDGLLKAISEGHISGTSLEIALEKLKSVDQKSLSTLLQNPELIKDLLMWMNKAHSTSLSFPLFQEILEKGTEHAKASSADVALQMDKLLVSSQFWRYASTDMNQLRYFEWSNYFRQVVMRGSPEHLNPDRLRLIKTTALIPSLIETDHIFPILPTKEFQRTLKWKLEAFFKNEDFWKHAEEPHNSWRLAKLGELGVRVWPDAPHYQHNAPRHWTAIRPILN